MRYLKQNKLKIQISFSITIKFSRLKHDEQVKMGEMKENFYFPIKFSKGNKSHTMQEALLFINEYQNGWISNAAASQIRQTTLTSLSQASCTSSTYVSSKNTKKRNMYHIKWIRIVKFQPLCLFCRNNLSKQQFRAWNRDHIVIAMTLKHRSGYWGPDESYRVCNSAPTNCVISRDDE